MKEGSQWGDRLRDTLGSIEWPGFVLGLLDWIAGHPGMIATLIAALIGILIFITVRNIYQVQRLEASGAGADTFPRRDWDTAGRLDAVLALEEGLRVFAGRDTDLALAVHYGALGVLHFQRGDAARAEPMLHKAIDLFELTGNRSGIAVYGRYLALLYREQGRHDRAQAFAERALSMYRTLTLEAGGAQDLPIAVLRDLAGGDHP